MVVIRLSPGGKKGAPVYRVTVAEQGARLTGKFVEKIGTYVPARKSGRLGETLNLNVERYNAWVKKGAQPSTRLVSVIKKLKIDLGVSASEGAAKAAPAVEAAPAKAAKTKAPAKKSPAKKA